MGNFESGQNALDYLSLGLEAAQTELASAEVALIEATARAEVAREAAQRFEAASAALDGKTPVGPPAPILQVPEFTENVNNEPQSIARAAAAELTPEQFDAQRKKSQKARRQEEIDANPYGTHKCPGCGKIGGMVENTLTTAGGGIVRMLVCGGCKNQQML